MAHSDRRLRFLTPRPPQPRLPLFVYLPGMDGTGHLLNNQVEGLDQTFDIRCLSIPHDDMSTWAELVEQVVSLIQQELAATGRRQVYLCGESFGGCLALQVLTQAPDLCDRLVLVNPASSFSRQNWLRWSTIVAPRLSGELYHLSTYGLLFFLIAGDRVAPSQRQALLTAMQTVTPESAAWRLALLSNFSADDLPLRQFQQPTLVMAGASDRLLPSSTEADLLVRHLPNAEKVLLPNSGHACLLERDTNLHQILTTHSQLMDSIPLDNLSCC